MNQETPEPNNYTPFTFTSAAGNEVVVTDEWVDVFDGALSQATVIDKVTDEACRFVLVETDDDGSPTMFWLRRINETCYVKTAMYASMDYVPDDEEEFVDEFAETIYNAEMELVMAVGLFPRYNIEADWMDDSRRDYLNKVQFQADAAAVEDVEEKRQGLLGISKLF